MQRRVITAVSALLAVAAIAAVSATPAAVGDISDTLDGIRSSHSDTPVYHGIYAVVVNPRDSDTVYVGTGIGVFASTNAGATWRAANDGLTETVVLDLAIHPQSPATLYAATTGGVFKSTDGGRNWRATGLTKVVAAWRLLLDPRRPKTVYAAGGRGVFKSSDGGEHWDALRGVSKRGIRVDALALHPRRSTTLYAGAGRGVFKSIDAGSSWSAMNRGLFPQESREEVEHRFLEGFVTAFAVNPRRPQTLYLGCDYGVFKSTNGARSWNAMARRGLPGHKKYRMVRTLALDPRNPQTLYAGSAGVLTGGVFKSKDGGRSWTTSLHLPQYSGVSALAFDPNNSRTIYAAANLEGGGEVFKSTDAGQTWRELSLPGF